MRKLGKLVVATVIIQSSFGIGGTASAAPSCSFSNGALTITDLGTRGGDTINVWQDTNDQVWASVDSGFLRPPTPGNFCSLGLISLVSVTSITVTGRGYESVVIWMTRAPASTTPTQPSVLWGSPAEWGTIDWTVDLRPNPLWPSPSGLLYLYAPAADGLTITAGDSGIDLNADGDRDVTYSGFQALIVNVTMTAPGRNVISMAGDATTGGPVTIGAYVSIAGKSDDTLTSGDSADISVFDSGPGNDVITGGPGYDVIRGGPGDDTIVGGPGYGVIDGGPGDDTIAGGNRKDLIRGGPGDDTLTGKGGDDQINGGPGDDEIAGGPGNDQIKGGMGRDVCSGGPGKDTVDCEVGRTSSPKGSPQPTLAPSCSFGNGALTITDDTTPGFDRIDVWQDTNDQVWASVQGAPFPTPGNFCSEDPISLTSITSITVKGGPAEDDLIIWMMKIPAAADPTHPPVLGGPPADWGTIDWTVDLGSTKLPCSFGSLDLNARAGLTLTAGASGIDLNGDGDVDVTYSRLTALTVDVTMTAPGRNMISMAGDATTGEPVGIGTYISIAGTSNDTLTGGGDGGTIRGGPGNDVITGGAGKDYISGGPGNDQIASGGGDDTIQGGKGRDVCSGGPGKDIVKCEVGRVGSRTPVVVAPYAGGSAPRLHGPSCGR